jgi:hypothetical protein
MQLVFAMFIHVNLPAGAKFSRFWRSLLSTFKIFQPWKKSSTKKSWPTFCDQYFWKFPIWNSHADGKRREIRMVKLNVIFNDIWLLICLTPLQVNKIGSWWLIKVLMIIQQLSTDWQLIGDKEVCLWHTLRWLEVMGAVKNSYKRLRKQESDNLWCQGKLLISIKRAMNSSQIELLWLVWDPSRSKYYLRTKFQDGIDKPQKCQSVCFHPTHQQQRRPSSRMPGSPNLSGARLAVKV